MTIKPVVGVIRSIVGTERNAITVIRRSFWMLVTDPQTWLVPNIALLRSYGVPESNIKKLLLRTSSTLWTANWMNEILEQVKKMKFDPAKYEFVKAIDVLLSLSKSSWEAKINIYKMWGWSEEEIYMAFTKQTQCMKLSKKKIMGTMEFIVNKMGYDPLLCVKYPLLLALSLEKRVIPRLLVLRVLISDGLVRKDCSIYTLLCMTDEKFKEIFLTKFVEKIPKLLDVYHGKMNAV
ncbi:Mitochondrial transcription termination factor family protein [Thalictrum thalictroides]|uniref:Mitochondrial transcription termination factor family protein n=1 Tax=Thalictrum thalictroides TaxID=46969 RepID=A0A7J6X8N9_THATH|nr:Mitochondrial transcription termination factor family protein [Thalictrum thalictroides]